MRAAYPTGADLSAFLLGLGVPLPSSLTAEGELQDAVDGAVSEWERITGWQPFLSDGDNTAQRVYTAPGPASGLSGGFLLALQGGGRILMLQSPLLVFTSLAVAGLDYMLGDQFFLRPANAPALGEPYTWIEFIVSIFSRPNDLVITGEWGRISANDPAGLPGDVKRAILKRAASSVAPEIALGISGGKVLQKAGDREERFAAAGDSGPLVKEAAAWDAAFLRTAGQWQRVVV